MECHSKWNVTQNGMSLKMKFHPNLFVPQNGMSRGKGQLRVCLIGLIKKKIFSLSFTN